MIDVLTANKWAFMIGAEVAFSLLASAGLIVRYWLELKQAAVVVLLLIVANEIFIILLAVLDYLQTGIFGEYQIFTVAFVFYALTLGHSDFKRLDRYLKGKVAQWKGETPTGANAYQTPSPRRKKAYGSEHARLERRGFYQHLLLYLAFQVVRVFLKMLNGEDVLASISQLWTVILLIDAIWSFSYTLFPRKELATNHKGQQDKEN